MPLTQESLRRILSYDKDLGEFTWLCPPKNHPRLIGVKAGSARNCSRGYSAYWVIKIDRKSYKRSQLAFLYVLGYMPNLIDHKNGDTLDDKFLNLRIATVQENALNHRDHRKESTLPQGVRLLPSGKYQARARYNGEFFNLGTFENANDASEEYEKFRKEKHGDFYAKIHRR